LYTHNVTFVFVCAEWYPTCIVLLFCFVCLRLVYPMLPVSLCFSSSCVPYVASFSVFFFVLCTLCCQFLCVFLRLVYPMLPVSLDCLCIAPSVFSNVYIEGNDTNGSLGLLLLFCYIFIYYTSVLLLLFLRVQIVSVNVYTLMDSVDHFML
jgi:hypothetical protein